MAGLLCQRPSGTGGQAEFCRYTLLAPPGVTPPDGFQGFIQWADVPLADAWFRVALAKTDPAVIATLESQPYALQAAHVASIWRALQFAYMALNVPAASDPVFVEMWRHWFYGYPPSDDQEFSTTEWSVSPEVCLLHGVIQGNFRCENNDARSVIPDSHRTNEERFGLLRLQMVRNWLSTPQQNDIKLRFAPPVFLNQFGFFEFSNWVFRIGGPRWNPAEDRIDRADDSAAPLIGSHDLTALVAQVTEDGVRNGLNVASPDYPGAPGTPVPDLSQCYTAQGQPCPPGRADWHSFVLQPPNWVSFEWKGAFCTVSLYDTLAPARWLAQRCVNVDPATNRTASVSALDVIFRSRLYASTRALRFARAAGDFIRALQQAGQSQAAMELQQTAPDPVVSDIANGIMGLGAAVASVPTGYTQVIGAVIVAIGGATQVINGLVQRDVLKDSGHGQDEFGRWKPTIDLPYLTGGIAADSPPLHDVPAPSGWTRPTIQIIETSQAMQRYSQTPVLSKPWVLPAALLTGGALALGAALVLSKPR